MGLQLFYVLTAYWCYIKSFIFPLIVYMFFTDSLKLESTLMVDKPLKPEIKVLFDQHNIPMVINSKVGFLKKCDLAVTIFLKMEMNLVDLTVNEEQRKNIQKQKTYGDDCIFIVGWTKSIWESHVWETTTPTSLLYYYWNVFRPIISDGK